MWEVLEGVAIDVSDLIIHSQLPVSEEIQSNNINSDEYTHNIMQLECTCLTKYMDVHVYAKKNDEEIWNEQSVMYWQYT